MRRIIYRGYSITAAAHQGEAVWHSRARVSRLRGGRERELHEKSSFTSERHAEAHALRLGQHWVNRRLRLKQSLVLFLFIVGLALAAAVLLVVLWIINFDLPQTPPIKPT
jgi:hypothetical protein